MGMNLKTWLNMEKGRAKTLAAQLGVSQGRITQMADGGVPVKYMLEICRLTENAVTLEQMVGNRTPHTETA